MESPPKRVTRARAAAKATEPKVKPTKIVTAAAKAKSSATASTKSASSKRKTRADDSDDEDEIAQEEVVTTRIATRGRPRTATVAEEPPKETRKATRGRPAKKLATEATKAASAAPAKSTRGRPKKAVEVAPEESKPEPVRKTTRAATNKSSTATTATKSTTSKKSVKFEEPDKENVEPVTKKDSKPAGIRGRPARRGGATAARSTRKTTEKEEKKPLSPKKVTQMPLMREDESEDELAGSPRVVVKPMKKGPVKPPSSVRAGLNLPERVTPEQDDDATINVNNAILNASDLTSTALSSPAKRLPTSAVKDNMKSPARRMPGITLPGSALKSTSKPTSGNADTSPSKNSLLFSAAKRPTSPIKGLNFSSPTKSYPTGTPFKSSMLSTPAKRSMPGLKPLTQPRIEEKDEDINASPAMKTFALTTSVPESSKRSSEKLMEETEETKDEEDEEIFEKPMKNLKLPKFSGRLSAILPRDDDPFVSEPEGGDEGEHEANNDVGEQNKTPQPESTEPSEEREQHDDIETEEARCEDQARDAASTLEPEEPMEEVNDPMDIDTEQHQEGAQVEVPTAGTHESEALTFNPNFALRQEVLEPSMDGDETLEPKSPAKVVCLKSATSPAKRDSRRSTIGLTALTEQFGSWNAVEANDEPEVETENSNCSAQTPATQQTPVTPHFFKDEMAASGEEQTQTENTTNEAIFTGLDPTTQDLDLAQEAEKLSQAGSPHVEQSHGNDDPDDTLSDASEEYGDENEMPIDPAITGSAPVTPVRAQKQTFFHTTTKVPLKPADHSTPSPLKKRSFTAPRPPPQRSSGLTRSTTLPSLSPTKGRRTSSTPRRASAAYASTPCKGDAAIELATPGRSRGSVNPNLLQGAVVFVDVHTSEGADASGIFMELLTQMGARCRKTWDWNDSPSASGASNKIGITHVVYKDGGKRTLEKVRRTKGLVQCVGVNWVLDCERENKWLDETSYSFDTSSVPRGGGRRRKSMEPKALANMNGTLIDNNSKSSTSQHLVPDTPLNNMSRRDSATWLHTPSDQGDEEQDDIEWSQFILTPLPKTPAPEAVAKAAAEVSYNSADDDTVASPMADMALGLRTCPPKASHRWQGQTSPSKVTLDDHALSRLMAARRKSLQFAPKIASPLSKQWKDIE